MKRKILIISLAALFGACEGKKEKNETPAPVPVVSPTPTPTPTQSPRPSPTIATPDDSLLLCYKTEGLSAAHNCSMQKKELLPKQEVFSAFTVKVDYPCKGLRVAMVLSTDLGQRVFWNKEPYETQTFTLYGRGPLAIEVLEEDGLESLLFQPGCYLKIADVTALPFPPESL